MGNQKATLEGQARCMCNELVGYTSDMARLGTANAELASINEDLAMKVARLERRLALYKNPNTPPSHESARLKGGRGKRRWSSKDDGGDGDGGAPVRKKPGRRDCHGDCSHSRKSANKTYRMPQACGHCGSSKMALRWVAGPDRGAAGHDQ